MLCYKLNIPLKCAHIGFVRVLSCLTASNLDVCALFTCIRQRELVTAQSPVSLNQRELAWLLQCCVSQGPPNYSWQSAMLFECSCCLCHVVSCPAVSSLREIPPPPQSSSSLSLFLTDRPAAGLRISAQSPFFRYKF